MTEAHNTASHGHAEVKVKTYMVIFGALCGFTLISFVANYAAHPDVGWITRYTSFAIILGVAVAKATLVAMYFMHLLFDWGKVFIMIVPALVLGPMLMIVLLPDIVLSKLALVPEPPAAVQSGEKAH